VTSNTLEHLSIDEELERFDHSDWGRVKTRKKRGRPKVASASLRADAYLAQQRVTQWKPDFDRQELACWLETKGFPRVECVYCAAKTTTDKQVLIDHRIPKAFGGSTGLDNLQLLCQDCYRRKGMHSHKNLIQWAAKVYTRFQTEIVQDELERKESISGTSEFI
jgi:5-methylcytosine-specific restriction endonuclease McrA